MSSWLQNKYSLHVVMVAVNNLLAVLKKSKAIPVTSREGL
jgi:hypothetical protein